MADDLLSHLVALYGGSVGAQTHRRLRTMMDAYHPRPDASTAWSPSQRDVILISYADQVTSGGEATLKTLGRFLREQVSGYITGVHILPFYPWSSDDGFSVTDYRAVDAAYGDWHDIERLRGNFHLMFDAVINHCSVRSVWFQGFLQGHPKYKEYFIEVTEHLDLSEVVRPRALPLLTRFETVTGEKSVWTTFSADQADLNFHNPDVLLEIIDILLFYVARGADLIRLDAIAYLWKEIGTPCIHRPQTYHVVRLFRAVLNQVAPHVLLVTETNVPHKDNVSYFGDGHNTAQMVYNFTLPPMLLHALGKGSSEALADWLSGLEIPAGNVTFFNFLASHDGIGLNPLRGLLQESEIDELAYRVKSSGGLVSHKNNADGTQSPYELNMNFFDALNAGHDADTLEIQVARFLTAHAILLAVVGVPGIYFHSLFGSRGWPEGVRLTGSNRSINRQKLVREELEAELKDANSLRYRIFQGVKALLRARGGTAAFHPYGQQRVIRCHPGVFALLRWSASSATIALCLHNLTPQPQTAKIPAGELGDSVPRRWRDLITQQELQTPHDLSFQLRPYQSLWIE